MLLIPSSLIRPCQISTLEAYFYVSKAGRSENMEVLHMVKVKSPLLSQHVGSVAGLRRPCGVPPLRVDETVERTVV